MPAHLSWSPAIEPIAFAAEPSAGGSTNATDNRLSLPVQAEPDAGGGRFGPSRLGGGLAGRRWARPLPIHPILFGAYFVAFVFAQNLGEVELAEVLPVLLLVVAGATAATVLAGLVLGDLRRGAIVASAGVVALLGYGHIANALVPYRVPGWLEQLGWAAILVVAVVVAMRVRGPLPTLTSGLNALAAVLMVLSLVQIVPHELARADEARAPSALEVRAGQATPGPKRDIWYFIFDRYASDRELRAAYGIDSDLDEWLTDRRFYVAQDSEANYVKTSLSLASSLNLAYLDDVARRMGPDSDDHGPIFEMMKKHTLGRFLRSQGYEFVQVGSAHGPTNVNDFADRNPRADSTSDFATAIYDSSAVPALARRLGITKATPSRERYYNIARFQWATVENLVDDAGPKLVFCHFLLPHPPYVFAADGSFVEEERNPRDIAANYGGQLAYTNSRIKAFVTTLLALPEERRPIIVLQADEGPYPARYNGNTDTFDWSTATDDELRMKYGILNAYYLPGLTETGLYPTITPVNSFRLILGRYFGTDTPLLPDRVYTSRTKFRPYDMTDVTERLTPPQP